METKKPKSWLTILIAVLSMACGGGGVGYYSEHSAAGMVSELKENQKELTRIVYEINERLARIEGKLEK